ncbi:MAG: DEAD/DEAH box helicase [Oceanococcaceae bacterium]
MSDNTPAIPSFDDLNLRPEVLRALNDVGYESPSPIQAAIIPHVLAGQDVLGQAQTGTGKTAAFALPLLSMIDLAQRAPQGLVLAPTRELAIQVAEAFQKYAAHLPGFHVLPIYGGQSYTPQLRALDRGVHVVVGTPGRVVDHLKRGTLKLDALRSLVLDEADEMLRMGFVDDVEWVLSQAPAQRQIALFSATMPREIKRIADTHLHNAAEITIKARTSTADNIRQRAWAVRGMHKLDALTRILEGEDYDGVIVFVRTKISTVELADRLAARGHEAVAINGDLDQKQRERTIEQFKAGKLDVLVATDVVARGIDVDRVSHVINYDIPHDTESYVHRIGRTGRAGRKGEAILFVAYREQRMLGAIERATRQRIEWMDLPTVADINDRRRSGFKERLIEALGQNDTQQPLYRDLIREVIEETNADPLDVAAALAHRLQDGQPLLLDAADLPAFDDRSPRREDNRRDDGRRDSRERNRPGDDARPPREARPERPRGPRPSDADLPPMETYRIAVGHQHHVEPRNIVGALANEAGLDSQYIGRIDIRDDHSLVDLPAGMPKAIFKQLKKVWVSGQQLQIQRADEGRSEGPYADRSADAAAEQNYAPRPPRPAPRGKPAPGGPKRRSNDRRDDAPRAAKPRPPKRPRS